MRTGDRKITINADLIVGHKYEVRVRAVGPDGTVQAMEDSVTNTIVIAGKEDGPDDPVLLTATGFLNAITVAWTNPANYDFSHMEVWRSATNDIDTAAKIANAYGLAYIDPLGSPTLTRYYWIRAVNTSGVASDYYPDTTVGVGATSLGVGATDIDDFAITVTKMFTNTIVLTTDVWSDNSPGAGSVAWNAHTIVYNGASYAITAGNTALAYVYWTIGNATYSASATHPALGTTAFMVAINTSGVHTMVWNSSANMVIGTAFIANLAVTDAKINTLSANKLTAGTIDASVITVTNLNAANISTGDIAVARITAQAANAVNAGVISISGARINITGTTIFASGWAAAANAESDINVLNTTNAPAVAGATDDTAANAAQITADAKTKVFRQDAEPGAGMVTGDIWIDTNDGNRPYTYSGAAWVETLTIIDGGKITTGTIDASVVTVTNINATNINTGTLTAITVQTGTAGSARVVISQADNTLTLFNSSDEAICVIDDGIGVSGIGACVKVTDAGSQFSQLERDRIRVESALFAAAGAIHVVKGLAADIYPQTLYAGYKSDNTNTFWVSKAGSGYFAGDITVGGTVDTVDVANHTHTGGAGGTVDHANLGNVLTSQHHVRYADAEAVTAMGVKGDANPLNHDRYTDAEAVSATTASYAPIAHVGAGGAAHADVIAAGAAGFMPGADKTKLNGIATGADVTGSNPPQSHTLDSHSGTLSVSNIAPGAPGTALITNGSGFVVWA